MKLELKHLVCYLPYGLKVNLTRKGFAVNGVTLNNIQHNETVNEYYIYHRGVSYGLYDIKPILRKRSSMTEEEQKESRIIIKNNIKYSDVAIQLMSFYSKNHFDIHNLIDNNLAIDINSPTPDPSVTGIKE